MLFTKQRRDVSVERTFQTLEPNPSLEQFDQYKTPDRPPCMKVRAGPRPLADPFKGRQF